MSDRDFYDFTHDGVRLRLPRVTSILRIIDRSNALMGWATRVERESFKAALEDILTEPGEVDRQQVWDRISAKLAGKRAYMKARDQAADIGQAAHRMIHWHTLRMLGRQEGPEPAGPDGALRAAVAWMEWAKDVDFTPLYVEHFVYCPRCAYAGTCDFIGKVQGQVVLGDLKTGKAVYDESHLQVLSYRHAAACQGIKTDAGLILRLPKSEHDPAFEVVWAKTIPYGYWISARRLWEWQQIMDDEDTGSTKMQKCEIEG
jgi:hypothetical protein